MRLRLAPKSLALAAVFAAIYATLSFLPLFPLVGASDRFVQAGNILAPLIGLILGPWLGALAVAVGGLVGTFLPQTGSFGPLSFVPHLAATLCAGLLYTNNRWLCSIFYLLFLLASAFYPLIGPAWLWPPFLWLHILALVFLFSPLQPKINDFLNRGKKTFRLVLGFGITSFLATLFGHEVGTLMFEIAYWPVLLSDVGTWLFTWQMTSWVYPVERGLIAVSSAVIGFSVLRALQAYGFKAGV